MPDPRDHRGVRHALVHVLALAAAAVLAGATSLRLRHARFRSSAGLA
ncbi:transposase family protein [Streptomyces sp. NPDC059168]